MNFITLLNTCYLSSFVIWYFKIRSLSCMLMYNLCIHVSVLTWHVLGQQICFRLKRIVIVAIYLLVQCVIWEPWGDNGVVVVDPFKMSANWSSPTRVSTRKGWASRGGEHKLPMEDTRVLRERAWQIGKKKTTMRDEEKTIRRERWYIFYLPCEIAFFRKRLTKTILILSEKLFLESKKKYI